MKRYLCIFLSVLCIAGSFSGCKQEKNAPSADLASYISSVMASPGDQPQLSKAEFQEFTDQYLATGQWNLPAEKAFLHTSGVNCSWYIIDGAYLFFLSAEIHYSDISSGAVDSVDYDFYLAHYIDGAEVQTQTDPQLFSEFLK